jgi:F-type H+-transporting ATPase subunit a
MAAENAGTHAPTSGEYIRHHLHHLQKDFSFQNVEQHGIVDFSLFNLDSVFYSIVLGVIASFFLWRAARKATSGVPGRFQAAVEILAEMVETQAKGAYRVCLDFSDERHGHVACGCHSYAVACDRPRLGVQ